MGRQWWIVLVWCAVLMSCSSEPLTPVSPAGFDLTGAWRLVDELSDPTPGSPAAGGPATKQKRPFGRRSRAGSNAAFVAHDFPVLKARTMDIEQNIDSMGITYDQGGYRDVSWGDRERGFWEVEAGWLDGVLMIRAESKSTTAREEFHLEGRLLRVKVLVESGGDELVFNRVFERR